MHSRELVSKRQTAHALDEKTVESDVLSVKLSNLCL